MNTRRAVENILKQNSAVPNIPLRFLLIFRYHPRANEVEKRNLRKVRKDSYQLTSSNEAKVGIRR